MVTNNILNNPRRREWDSFASRLTQLLGRTAEAAELLALSPPFSEHEQCCGAKALGDAAVTSAYECLAVTAACNAVLRFASKPAGPQMASKTMSIVRSMPGFDLPKPLAERLATLAGCGARHRRRPNRGFRGRPRQCWQAGPQSRARRERAGQRQEGASSTAPVDSDAEACEERVVAEAYKHRFLNDVRGISESHVSGIGLLFTHLDRTGGAELASPQAGQTRRGRSAQKSCVGCDRCSALVLKAVASGCLWGGAC